MCLTLSCATVTYTRHKNQLSKVWKKNSKPKVEPFVLNSNMLMQGKRNTGTTNGKGPFSKLNSSVGKKFHRIIIIH